MTTNPRNAGRKPLPYTTKTMRVPVDLMPTFAAQISQYKIDGEHNAKFNATKTDK
jgi:hypothetical protein